MEKIFIVSVTRTDWKGNPHSTQAKRIHVCYWIYNLIKHILSGYWSICNVILLSQPFGWVLSSHLSSWLLTWIVSAQIKWTTPAGSLNVIAFLASPIGSCVCTIQLVFSLSFCPPCSSICRAHCSLYSSVSACSWFVSLGLSKRRLLARLPANTLI